MSNQPQFPDSGDAYRPTVHTASSGQTDYSFSWPYIGQENYDGTTSPYILVIHVSDEGTRSFPSFTMPTSSSIRLATAVSEGQIIIMRQSWVNGLLVDFAGGATLSESTLDLLAKQAYYLWEESVAISLDAYNTNNDDAKFNAIFQFSGDDSTTAFRLTNASHTVNEEPGEVAIWAFIGGAFVQSQDYGIYQDSDEVVVVDFDRAPEAGEFVEIRVAQFQALSAAISDGQIDCDMLAEGSICALNKFDLDDEGTARYVLGWNASTVFGARALTHDDISDFDTEVEAKRLDQFAVPTANVSMNSNKITNVTDPTSAQDAATKAYVDANAGGISDIDSTVTGVSMSKEVARSNNGSTAMFVSALVEIGVNGQDTVSLQIKPTASGSWTTVATAEVSVAASNTHPPSSTVSFFVPVGYDYRWTGTWSQNSVTVTEQQLG